MENKKCARRWHWKKRREAERGAPRKIMQSVVPAALAAALILEGAFPFRSTAAEAASAAADTASAVSGAVSVNDVLTAAGASDPDGRFLLSCGIQNGDDIGIWCEGHTAVVSALDTAVHEEAHRFSLSYGSSGVSKVAGEESGQSESGDSRDAIYTGNGGYITVPKTQVFKTWEWADSIPEVLRTSRYDAYVAAGVSSAANDDGVYGLLNELNGYAWGMNADIRLMETALAEDPVLQNAGITADWGDFVHECESNYLAFCEFRWWTLGYLDYAMQVHPDIWVRIMENQDYINAYCITERRFENLIVQYKEVRSALGVSAGPYFARRKDDQTKRLVQLYSRDEAMLLGQISQQAFAAQEQYLFAHCTVEVSSQQNVYP